MSTRLILADLAGMFLAFAGFSLAFRQRAVRERFDAWRAGRGLPVLKRAATDAEDPVHYAMIISGTMIMAFGIILFGFTTMFALS